MGVVKTEHNIPKSFLKSNNIFDTKVVINQGFSEPDFTYASKELNLACRNFHFQRSMGSAYSLA